MPFFLRKNSKNMLVNSNFAENYASIIRKGLQILIPIQLVSLVRVSKFLLLLSNVSKEVFDSFLVKMFSTVEVEIGTGMSLKANGLHP